MEMPRTIHDFGGFPDALSIEEGLAQTLGVTVGDRLRFDIAGQAREGRITSIRRVDWGSMRVNFFVMFPVSAMPELPATSISAFRAPAQPGFDNALSRRFPNITNVDVSASVAQVQRVLDQVIRAVEFLFGFTLVAGEVRSLAQRSAEAAREIKSLIGASVERVEAGTRLVQDAGGTMGEIVASVQRVSDIIAEISSAAGEQSSGIRAWTVLRRSDGGGLQAEFPQRTILVLKAPLEPPTAAPSPTRTPVPPTRVASALPSATPAVVATARVKRVTYRAFLPRMQKPRLDDPDSGLQQSLRFPFRDRP